MLDEYGFETERDYTISVSEPDVSASDDRLLVGAICMTNGKNTFDVDYEHNTRTGKNAYSYFERDAYGQYHEAKLPLQVLQSLEAFDTCVNQKVDEYIRENEHDRHRGFER